MKRKKGAVRQSKLVRHGKLVRYNLGCGPKQLPGYINIDRSLGTEAYPLAGVADCSVDEVRASHLLEHFSHTMQMGVLREWVRVLKPGGVLKVAVPDFDKIVDGYRDGLKDFPVEEYLMGSHSDQNDLHNSIWSAGKLKLALEEAGLVDVKPWTSEVPDCAALPVSLNLQATKPSSQVTARSVFVWPKMALVQSVPRLGFMDNNKCIFEACLGLPITLRQVCGVFWGSCMTKGFDQALADDPEFIVTVDYDTVFTRDDLLSLVKLMKAHPEADAIAPLQAGRDRSTPLITIKGPDGNFIGKMDAAAFKAELVPVASAHFGLTIIRASSVKATPKPWFSGIVRNGVSADDDIYFWRRWEKQGRKLFLAPHVVVGHLELVVAWPGDQFRTFHQSCVEYREKGKPEGVWK